MSRRGGNDGGGPEAAVAVGCSSSWGPSEEVRFLDVLERWR